MLDLSLAGFWSGKGLLYVSCKKFQKAFPASVWAVLCPRLSQSATLCDNIFKRRKTFVQVSLLWEIICFREELDVTEATIHTPGQWGRRRGRHARAAILLQLVKRWQGEPLQQPIEPKCGAKSHLKYMKDPTPEQRTASNETHDSKGRSCYSSPSLGWSSLQKGPTPVEVVHGGLSPMGGMPCCCRGIFWEVFLLRRKEQH